MNSIYFVYTPDHFFTGEPTVSLITDDLEKAEGLAESLNGALKPQYRNWRVVTTAEV